MLNYSQNFVVKCMVRVCIYSRTILLYFSIYLFNLSFYKSTVVLFYFVMRFLEGKSAKKFAGDTGWFIRDHDLCKFYY